MLALFLLLMSFVAQSLGRADTAPTKTTIQIEQVFSLSQGEESVFIPCFDQRNDKFVVLRTYTFDLYIIDQFNQPQRTYEQYSHGIRDIQKFKHCILFSSGRFLVVTDYYFYFYMIEGQDVSKYNKKMPLSYFKGVNSFSKMVSVNSWNNTIVMKTDNNQLHVFDLRKIDKLRSYPVSLDKLWKTNNEDIEIKDLVFTNYGRSIALHWKDHSQAHVHIIDPEGKSDPVHLMYSEMDTRYNLNYHITENKLIIGDEEGILVFSSRNKLTRTISYPEGFSFANEVMSSFTHLFASMSNNKVAFYDEGITDLSDKVEPEAQAEGMISFEDDVKLLSVSPTRNLIIGFRLGLKSSNQYVFFNFTTENPKFCHHTCQGSCPTPFKHCDQRRYVYVAFGLGVTAILVLLCACHKWIDFTQAYVESKEVSKFNEALTKASNIRVNQGNKRGSIFLQYDKPDLLTESMIKSLD